MGSISLLGLEVGAWTAIVILAVLLLTLIWTRKFRSWLDEHFTHFTHLIHIEPARYKFLRHFLSGFMFLIGVGIAIYFIPSLRQFSVSIFAGAGVLAIIMGFAAQQALGNVMSGIFLAVFKPFRVGDWIRVDDRYGTVEDITLRHTVIRSPENKRIILPNSVIGNAVIENSEIGDKRVCKFVDFSISYDSNIDKAFKIMAQEAQKHPNYTDVRTQKQKDDGEPAVRTKVTGFGDSSVKLRAWVWAKDPFSAFMLGWDLNKSIKERFDKEGIEIPYPYRTIVQKKRKSI